MKVTARIAVVTYALAIVLASVAPHCAWMFAPIAEAAASPHAQSHAMEHHAGTHGDPKGGECASMAMAKSMGPLPIAFALTPPSDVSLPAFTITLPPPAFVGPADAKQPRGPPLIARDFASVFASNHRLLI